LVRIVRTALLDQAMPHRCRLRGRAGDALAGQHLGDREQPAPAEELAEDPLDDRRGLLV
jgi:hypothetical protein